MSGPPQVSLALLIDFIVQRTYHDLSVLAELLPRKTDMERKIEIFNFASRTRMLFIRSDGVMIFTRQIQNGFRLQSDSKCPSIIESN